MSGENILALSGGVGGAKLSWGLDNITAKNTLTIIANTGDDFIHHGLYISPDSDTLIYTLAGVNDPEKGWGRADETWHTHSTLGQLESRIGFRLAIKIWHCIFTEMSKERKEQALLKSRNILLKNLV